MKTKSFSQPSNNEDEEPYSYVIKGIKPVIFIGRILGVIPRTDVLRKIEDKRLFTFTRAHSVLVILYFLCYFIFQTKASVEKYKRRTEAYQKLNDFVLPGYSLNVLFIYAYLLYNSKRLRSLINAVSTLDTSLCFPQFPHFNTRSSRLTCLSSYSNFCMITLICIMTYGISENVLNDLQIIHSIKRIMPQIGNSTVSEEFFWVAFFHWRPYISYNIFLSIALFTITKCGTYGWISGDILVIVLCRALTVKLRQLNVEIKLAVEDTVDPIKAVVITPIVNQERKMLWSSLQRERTEKVISWENVRNHYLNLSDLILEVQGFISPLILSCYGINVYLIIINLFYWIAPNTTTTTEQAFYRYFAFTHFFFRVSSVTYFVAEVYHAGKGIVETLQKCPNSMYILSMERLEKSMLRSPCGISLFGTFMITRKFFVSIISFIFTTEIVIMQTNH